MTLEHCETRVQVRERLGAALGYLLMSNLLHPRDERDPDTDKPSKVLLLKNIDKLCQLVAIDVDNLRQELGRIADVTFLWRIIPSALVPTFVESYRWIQENIPDAMKIADGYIFPSRFSNSILEVARVISTGELGEVARNYPEVIFHDVVALALLRSYFMILRDSVLSGEGGYTVKSAVFVGKVSAKPLTIEKPPTLFIADPDTEEAINVNPKNFLFSCLFSVAGESIDPSFTGQRIIHMATFRREGENEFVPSSFHMIRLTEENFGEVFEQALRLCVKSNRFVGQISAEDLSIYAQVLLHLLDIIKLPGIRDIELPYKEGNGLIAPPRLLA